MALGITREGRGTIYRFADKQSCICHPLWQWGDAVFEDVFDLFQEYRLHEIPELLRRSERGEEVAASLESRVAGLREQGLTDRRVCDALIADGTARDILEVLDRLAVDPPDDPETVLELVRGDRAAHLRQRKDTPTMAEAKTKEAKTKEAKVKEPKEVKPKLIAGHDPKARIEFGVAPDKVEKIAAVKEVKDKDGKVVKPGVPASEKVIKGEAYHPTKNNPKRGKGGERFALYKPNMTLEAAVAAGVTPADIAWDLSKGFISIKA